MPARLLRTTAVLALVFLGGCGTRTGLLLSDQNGEATADSTQDASTNNPAPTGDDNTASEEDGGVFCSLYAGPVGSCDAGPDAGPVQRCDTSSPYSKCIRIFRPGGDVPYGQWGCCWPDPPENVNQCLDRQFLRDASCL
jgi:hypothetical protein